MKKIFTESDPLVSLIVLSADDAQITLECLEALERCTKYARFEVIVVDNGSVSKQWSLLRKGVKRFKAFQIQLVRNKENLGYAKANNDASKRAKGDLLVLLNNDVIVTPGWLKPLVSFMRRHRRVVACQPKLRSFMAKEYFDYAGGAGGFLDMFGYPFTRGRVFDSIEKDVGQYDVLQEITWASGSCLVIDARAFREAGGFDEYFFSYMEEIDLCLRLRQQGYTIFCVPQSVVYHYGAYTSNRNLTHKIYMNHRNNLYFVFKHYSLWPTFPILVVRLIFDLFSVLHYLLEYQLGFIGPVLRAHLSLVVSYPRMIRHGVFSLRGRSLLDDKTVYRGSIVVDHFLFGKDNFDRIFGRESDIERAYKRYVDVTYFQERESLIHGPTKT